MQHKNSSQNLGRQYFVSVILFGFIVLYHIQTGAHSQFIYTEGCYGEFEELIEDILPRNCIGNFYGGGN